MNDSTEFADLLKLTNEASLSIERAVRTLRALAPVLVEIRGLQEKIEELQNVASAFSTGDMVAPVHASGSPAPPTPQAAPVAVAEQEQASTAPTPISSRAPESPRQGSAAARAEPTPVGRATASDGASGPRTISVTLVRTDGPLDLVPVHTVLSGMSGVTRLAVASYTRDRAVILLDTDRSQKELNLDDALKSVFPDGVRTEWKSDTEYLVTVGAEAIATS